MSETFLLDSSAVMCALMGEPGAGRVRAVWGRSVVSAVNLGEVATELNEKGMSPDDVAYVPGGLPGETVEADVSDGRATITAVLEASPDRVKPPCPHFGVCGGCAVQHWAEPAAAGWKRDLVVGAR